MRATLEVAFFLLLLHRAGLIVVDEATLALGEPSQEHFLDDVRHGARIGLDGARQWVAPERSKPHPLHLRYLAGLEWETVVVDQNQRAIPLDDRPLLGEVERDDGDVFEVHILPYVELGPVRERKDAYAFPLVNGAV